MYSERARSTSGAYTASFRAFGSATKLGVTGFIPGRALSNSRSDMEKNYANYQTRTGAKTLPLVEKLLRNDAINQRDLRVVTEDGKEIPLQDYIKSGGATAFEKLQRGVVRVKSTKEGEAAAEMFGTGDGKTLAEGFGADVLAGIQSTQLEGGYDPSSYTNATNASTNTGTYSPTGASGSGRSLVPTGSSSSSTQKVDVQTGVTIDLSPEARRWLKTGSTTGQIIDEKADVGSSERNSLKP
jgi:hypothetical protein